MDTPQGAHSFSERKKLEMQGDMEKECLEFFNLMSALADSVIEAPAGEIEEQIAEDGVETEEIRAVFLNAVRLAKRQQLSDARAAYESDVAAFRKLSFEIPETSQGKREMLTSIFGTLSQPQQQALTAHFRDFEELADDDLDGIIRQLLALKNAPEDEGSR